MARNKHPEVTVEKILDVAQRLFLKKGYDNTTIQDIVNELGGLTKGAIYHHFKSKEDIVNALTKNVFYKNNPFELAKKDTSLNGLEKLKKILKFSIQDSEKHDMDILALPLIKNPRFLASFIDNQTTEVAPLLEAIIEEGIQDNSIKAEHAKLLAELFILLTSFWLSPSIFTATYDESMDKIRMAKQTLDFLGLPVIDDELLALSHAAAQDIIK